MPRQLPTELLRHIIKLALPIVSYGTYLERYDFLLAFSLVDTTWSALAQEELNKEVFVKTGEELEAALKGKGREMGRRIRLGANLDRVRREPLEVAARFLANAKSLYISCMWIDAAQWPALEGVESLHLNYVDLGLCDVSSNPPPPPTLPNGCLFQSLTSLSLVEVCLVEEFPLWTEWFTPSNLPHLSRLVVSLLSECTFGEDDDFVKALQQLAPQIQHLTVSGGFYGGSLMCTLPWSAFAAVRHLAVYIMGPVDQGALFDAVLGQLSATSLSHLIVGCGHEVWDEDPDDVEVWEERVISALLQAVDSDFECLRQLTTLVVHHEGKEIKEETRESMGRLDEAMRARGGRLEQRVGWGEREGLLEWERYLDVWR